VKRLKNRKNQQKFPKI